MKELIGTKIVKVEMQDDTTIVFNDISGITFSYQTFEDCCSSTWISHISGLNNLLNATVREVKERQFSEEDQKKAEQEGDYDVLALYGYDIVTDKGICFLEFRNNSNGYYGGDLEYYDTNKFSFHNLREITEDF